MKMWIYMGLMLVISGCDGDGDGNTDSGADDSKDESTDKDDGDGECDLSTASNYQTVERDGVTREYLLHVPSSYQAGTPMPLVIAYHGNGGCADGFADYEARLDATADTNGFIVAYPQGVARAKGGYEWDPGNNDSTSIQDNDLVFTDALIDAISASYTVNDAQIYAVGYSNGGMMAYGAACHRSNRVAAVGVMSGVMLADTDCDTSQATSVVHLHGTDDGVLPIDGGGDFPSVTSGIDFWVAHNGITAGVDSTDLGGGVTRDRYTGGQEDTSVVLYTIQGGGHVWFASDDIGGSEANQVLWDFLSGYTLTGTTN